MLKIEKILYEDKIYIREELETETLFNEKCKAIDLDGFTEKFFSVTGSFIREQDGKEYTEDIDRYPFCVFAGDHLKKRFRERFSGYDINCVLDRISEFFTQDFVFGHNSFRTRKRKTRPNSAMGRKMGMSFSHRSTRKYYLCENCSLQRTTKQMSFFRHCSEGVIIKKSEAVTTDDNKKVLLSYGESP